MLTESRALVVVDFEAVRHVDLEPLFVELQEKSQVGNSLLSISALHGKQQPPDLYHGRWGAYCPCILGYEYKEETIDNYHSDIQSQYLIYNVCAVQWQLGNPWT